jgi:hypothetical protein
MLTAEDMKRLRKDFIDWTGGYGAHEVEPEKIDLYVELALPYDIDPVAAEEYLSSWALADD